MTTKILVIQMVRHATKSIAIEFPDKEKQFFGLANHVTIAERSPVVRRNLLISWLGLLEEEAFSLTLDTVDDLIYVLEHNQDLTV